MAKINQLISNFYDKAIAEDFARDFNFRVTVINPSPSIVGVTFNETDLVYAKSASIPGRDITNVEASYMGLKFNIPGVVSYPGSSEYKITFYCDKASNLRNKFEAWSRATFNDVNSTGNYDVPGRSSYIQLAQLKPDFSVVREYKLVGVSIRTVGTIDYKMAEGTGEIQEFEVGIAYHFYEIVSGGSKIPAGSNSGNKPQIPAGSNSGNKPQIPAGSNSGNRA